MGKLDSKVILVAGAGAIGDACALRYGAEGASVVLGDIRAELTTQAVRAIQDAGGQAVGIHLDGADEASVEAAVKLTVDRFGGLDGLHANFTYVGEGTGGSSVLDLPLAIFDRTMEVNVRGFLLCTRHALPHIIARGGGAVTFTSSGAATRGVMTRFAYGMSKAAIQSLMRHVATRFGNNAVRCNAIAPGVNAKPGMLDEIKAIAMNLNAIKRIGRPIDIASIAALLMSDEGSYITGQIINVDGGATMRP